MTQLKPSNKTIFEDGHWISSYITQGDHDIGVKVYITMGGECWKNFSQLRLIVAFNKNDFTTPPMQECIDHGMLRLFSTVSESSGPGIYRDAYRQKLRSRKSYGKDEPYSSAGTELPVCNVLILLGRETVLGHQLVPTYVLRLYTFEQLEELGRKQLRVLMDRTWSCASGPPLGLVALLDHPGIPLYNHDGQRVVFRTKRQVYHLVVLPFKRNPHSPNIPKHIIYFIVQLAHGSIEDSNLPARRKQLLAYALVHRSWTHVLDIFFQEIGSAPLAASGDPVKIARSLLACPEHGRMISGINLLQDEILSPTKPFTDLELFLASSKEIISAYNTIIVAASFTIKKFVVTLPTFRKLLDGLPAFANLETFILSGISGQVIESLPISNHKAHMHKIQSCCSQWKKLGMLKIEYWDDPLPVSDYESDSYDQTFRNMLKVPLLDLTLSNGVLCRDNILAFGCKTLTTLKLDGIKGITNVDLADFLDAIASSLIELTIINCNFPKQQGEVHAVERMLPSLRKLLHLYLIAESGLSCGIIAEGTGDVVSSHPSDAASKHHETLLGLFIKYTPPVPIEALPQALERTAWKTILIDTPDSDEHEAWFTDLEKRCHEIAKRRGIKLYIH